MTPRLRKVGVTAHITVSVGWIGSVAAFLALSICGLTSQNGEVVRGAYFAMNLICRLVIVPLSLASLATGVVQAVGTDWGLFRHSWVLVKFLLTTFATIVLLAKLPLAARAARLAEESTTPSADLHAAGLQLAVHAAGGLLVLLAITTLSVFKPWGRTRYGRKQPERPLPWQEAPATTPPTPADSADAIIAVGPPSRFKAVFAIIGALAVGFVVWHLIGGGIGHLDH